MRSILMAAASLLAALLLLVAARATAEPATCAILFRDLAATSRAAAIAADLSVPPETLLAAFRAPGSAAKANASRSSLSRWWLATYPSSEARDAGIAAWRQHADVEFVEAIRRMHIAPEWRPGSQEVTWNVEQVGAIAALQEVQGDTTLIVAVIDTGADLTHPDLRNRLWDSGDAPGNATPVDDLIDQNGDGFVEEWEKQDDDNNGYVDDQHGYDFTDAPGQGGVGDDRDRDPQPQDDHGHGTHVAGIIAAQGSLQGVAPFVRLMPVRAAYTTGFGGGVLRTDDAAAAIVYAVDNGARVLNLSWGDTVESRLIRAAIDHAIRADVLVVAAAGNDGKVGAHWPAADPRVVGVGSSMRNGARSSFSNSGVGVDLLAPGEEAPFPQAGIVSLEPLALVASGRGERRGTSMAAPHVTGVAAIVLSRSDHPDMATARALLLDSAQRTGADWTSGRGHGRVDALAAVRQSSVLLAMWHGPDAPYEQGRLRADASVWGAALQRFEIVAQHAASGTQVLLRPWESASYWQHRLLDLPLPTDQVGTWQLILRVEDTDGVVRERRMRFDVDNSVPQLDSLFVQPVWRGPQPRWLLSALWEEAVSLHVRRDAVVVTGNAGLASRHQQEIVAAPELAGSWSVAFHNEAGLGDTLLLTVPDMLAAWPPMTRVREVSVTAAFLPQSAWGRTPGGRRVVWGQGGVGAASGFLQAAQVVGDTLQVVYDAGHRGRPVAYDDVNGDGRADLLVQNGLAAEWWTTCPSCEFPESRIASIRTERVLGLFQLDTDAALETILSTGDSLLLFDDASSGVPVLLQVLVNPAQQGFAFWGADAAVADLDGDARIELVCGDGEGNVSVFEAEPGQPFTLQELIDTQGSYAYDLSALPPDGFVVGRQRTSSVTGDGFDSTSYEFLRYRFDAGSFVLEEAWPFVVATGDLSAGSAWVPGPAAQLVLARGADVYLLQDNAGIWEKVGWLAGAVGEPPIAGDLRGDGSLTWVLPTAEGGRLLTTQSAVAPHSLVGTSLGPGRLSLTWEPGDGNDFRVQRRMATQAWQALGETTGTSWVDSTAAAHMEHEYEVQMLSAGFVVGTSNRIAAHSQPLPRLVQVDVVGPTALRCRFSNAMQATTLQSRSFSVGTSAGALPVLEVSVAEQGRSVALLLGRMLPCDSIHVEVSTAVRDDQNGLLDPQATGLTLLGDCRTTAFLVHQVSAEANGFLLRFSEPPASPANLVGTYSVTWNGVAQALSAVQARSSDEYFVQTTQPLVGRGIPYLLSVDPQLQSASGKALQVPVEPFEVLFSGRGAQALYVAPNPVRAGTREVSFLEAAEDTRVTIYNLEGERITTLHEVRGGALRWDLRTAGGALVPSGTYLYVARDATGSATGRLVLIR